MDTLGDGILLGFIIFIILLIVIHIMKKYTDITNMIGKKIIGFLKNLSQKTK